MAVTSNCPETIKYKEFGLFTRNCSQIGLGGVIIHYIFENLLLFSYFLEIKSYKQYNKQTF